MAKAKKKIKKAVPLLRLDLGCGAAVRDGFRGVDKRKLSRDIVQVHLGKDTWPFKDSSVEEAQALHVLQYLTPEERTHFANELYRVLAPGAKCLIVFPHWNSVRALQDPLAKSPALVEPYFGYWNADGRIANGVDWYGFTCDFDATAGYALNAPWSTKADEPRNFAMQHNANVIFDTYVTVTSKKK